MLFSFIYSFRYRATARDSTAARLVRRSRFTRPVAMITWLARSRRWPALRFWSFGWPRLMNRDRRSIHFCTTQSTAVRRC